MIQPNLINLHLNEYSQEFHYYPIAFKLDRWVGSCKTFNDLSNKVCFPNKTEHLNLTASNMITGINELKTWARHISSRCNVFDHPNEIVIQIKGGITINVDMSLKNVIYAQKIIYGILLYAVVKMGSISQLLWMIQWLRVMNLKSHTTKKQKQFQ